MTQHLLLTILVVLAGCVGQAPPPPSQDGSGTSVGDGSTDSSPPTLADSNSTASSTDGTTGTPSATTSGSDTTSTSGTNTGTDTSVGTSTGEPIECNPACGSNQICDAGECVSICAAGWGDGSYAYCLNEWGAPDVDANCGSAPDAVCVLGTPDFIEAAVCSAQSCNGVCDCPPPPATGNATVTCGALTIGDGVNDCYLSCANGEACPDDMVCRNNEYCTHAPQPLSMYGDCGNVDAPCAEGTCETYQAGAYSMCVATCNDVGMCDAAPPGGNSESCDGVLIPPNGSECVILCNTDNDCPFSMECVQSTACLWPI